MTERIALIKEFLDSNVNMILVGSCAANYYGYKIISKSNDIDFIIDDSYENMFAIYNILKNYNPKLILNELLKSYVIKTIIEDNNEKIDMFRFSKKSTHINYNSINEQKEYVIDTFYSLSLKIISHKKLKEIIEFNNLQK